MLTHIKKAKDRVRHLMEAYPATRDDDKLLWLAYLVVFHGLKDRMGEAAYQQLKSVVMNSDTCTMASIVRVRRKIQAEGDLHGSPEVMARRTRDDADVHDYYAGGNE